ncbi:MAG: CocE/NonD family hydrolase C-terminal non-catalytic domain-containing protein, partial [Stellaceae bacterium]
GVMSIEIPLFAFSDSVSSGNRLRVAVSTSYWPMLWPAAKSGRVVLHASRSRVSLPARVPRAADGIEMAEPESAPTFTWTPLRAGGYRRQDATNGATGERIVTITEDMGTGRIEEIDLSVSECTTRTFRMCPDEPSSAVIETQMTSSFGRRDWSAETSVRGRITAEAGGMQAWHELEAREGDRRVYRREWREAVPPR